MGQRIGIMQPYFLPYMGYWQLINCVDTFVLYDTIQYTKKGWITRNRFLQNGHDEMFSLSVRAASSTLDVIDRELSPEYDRKKMVRVFEAAYGKAPYFESNFPILKDIIMYPEMNLFLYIENSIHRICEFLGVRTPVVCASALRECPRTLKGQDRVINICKALGGDHYINPIGGVDLYSRPVFKNDGLELQFLRSKPMIYECYGHPCIPHMSIVDVMMFNARETIIAALGQYELE